jgi:hypothetical protein
MTEMIKARIFRVDQPDTGVDCQFNPKTYQITRNIKWVENEVTGDDDPVIDFGGGGAKDFSVELLFDSTDTGQDVRSKYSVLLQMAETNSSKKNQKTNKSEPPECKFQWGNYLSFTGVIRSITQNFTMFKGDGTPLRAYVNVSFIQTPKKVAGQNPTSASESRKIWIVREGETLDWIAYQEYGSPAHWRHIAETNDLDNPLDLHPGQALKLVPLA